MGRSSGFIAMQASLASGQVDICLIPEVRFYFYFFILSCNRKEIERLLITKNIHFYKGSFQSPWTSWCIETFEVPYRNKRLCCNLCCRRSRTGKKNSNFWHRSNPLRWARTITFPLSFLPMQSFLENTNAKDASGNKVLGDIGVHIQQEVWFVSFLNFFNQEWWLTKKIDCS